MTKEELEKDVRTYLRQQLGLNGGGMVSCDLKKLLLGFAEPREKRIEELETRCSELFLQNNEFAERFAKSIEIIKEFLNAKSIEETCVAESIAEQFLQEIEK